MTIEDVKVIIQGDETRTVEMKKTTGELKDGILTRCLTLCEAEESHDSSPGVRIPA